MHDSYCNVVLPQPEVWRPIKDFEGFYEVSNYGRVKSLARYIQVVRSNGETRTRRISSRIMKNKYDKYGVDIVGLSDEGVVKQRSVYSLVIDAFLGDVLYMEHKDNNYSNNHILNIKTVDTHTCTYKDLNEFTEATLTKELVHECFDYHEDGYLVWKKRPPEHFLDLHKYRIFNTTHAGKIVGYYNKRTDSRRDDFGYWRTAITLGEHRRHFKLNRLIFFWHHGYFPEVVDHKDGDQENNRITNLREGDVQKNSCNLRVNVNNTSGYKGVSYSSRKSASPWRCGIVSEGVSYFLGFYPTSEHAAYAYNLAAKVLHKDFAYLNDVNFNPSEFTFKGKFFTQTYPKLLEIYKGNSKHE